MLCQMCGKEIGVLRRLVDREFCSAKHRHEARTCLDRSLADIDDFDVSWATTPRTVRRGGSSAQTASAALVVVMVLMVIATLGFAGRDGGPSYPSGPSTKAIDTSSWFRRMGNSISSVVRSKTPSTMRDDFHSGISDWISSGAKSASGLRNQFQGSDWSYTPTGLKPGKLRIWQKSTELKNYEVDFLAQIDKKSMGWAFRALDVKNFYGTKLTILHNGDGPNAGLVRYTMLNGRESDRTNLPLPINIAAGTPYRVRVAIKGDHFITSVNGQVVSSWKDQKLVRGGVGFFTDEGESATVRWVNVAERDSLVGRVLSYFSLIQMPIPGSELNVE